MKKKILVVLATIFAIVLLLFAIGFVALGIASFKGYSVSEGRVLVTDNGSYMIIDKNNSPIVMSNQSKNEKIFEGLTNGDEILIVHDGIQESYPGGTGVYFCKKLADGEYKDLPEQTLFSLAEMGWISKENAVTGELVEVNKDDKMLSLVIPEGWEYSTSNAMDFSSEPFIEFWPKGEDEGRIKFMYDENFGVCGTGLTSEEVILGGHKGSMGTYDNNSVFSFIAFDREFVILNMGADEWWNEYGTEAMEILVTLEYR